MCTAVFGVTEGDKDWDKTFGKWINRAPPLRGDTDIACPACGSQIIIPGWNWVPELNKRPIQRG
jgi:hypothetical protein